MKIKTVYIGLIFAILLFFGIETSDALGIWITESSKVPATIQEGEFAGSYDPGDIRGSYAFKDIEESYGVPVETLAKAFNVTTEDPSLFLCKELETIYENTDIEIGTGSVRQFVAFYTGLPYEGDDGFPSTAVQTLKDEDLWTDLMANQLDGRIINNIDDVATSLPAPSIEEAPVEDISRDEHEAITTVTGKTTVADAIELGLTLSIIEETLGVEVANDNLAIKDLCSNNGLSFGEIKDKLNKLLP